MYSTTILIQLHIIKLSDPIIDCGDYLGDLTDEILKNYGTDAKCVEFVALGPKNYGYSVLKPDGSISSEIKCKGISLNFLARQSIDFEKVVNMATSSEDGREVIMVDQRQFDLNKHNQIKTRYFKKQYRITSDKRYLHNGITYPYGYIQ